MINWKESAKLNNMSIEELKVHFDTYPSSSLQIIRTCDNCGKKQKLNFYNYCDLCRKCSPKSLKCRKAMSDAAIRYHAKEKDPLPQEQKITIPKNKNCASFLGSIAEELLAKTFKDVRRMPSGNCGYDIICNQNFKIDIKSSATGYKGYWVFTINKNTIADYFLCIAFESREDLNPVHLWLIPGEDINNIGMITINKSTIIKWTKYEQLLDRVLACCDVMRGDNNV